MKSKLVFIFGLLASSVLAQEPFQPPIYVPGSGGGGPAAYNPAAVTITGGDVSNVTGTGKAGRTRISSAINIDNGSVLYLQRAPMGTTCKSTYAGVEHVNAHEQDTGHPNETLTFTATPPAPSQQFRVLI